MVWSISLFFALITPFRIEDAQYATPSPLITAHKVGVLNEKRCKMQKSALDERLNHNIKK